MKNEPNFEKSFFELKKPEIDLLFKLRKDIIKKLQLEQYKSKPTNLHEFVIMVKLLGEIQRLEVYNTPFEDLLKKNEKGKLRHRLIQLLYLNINSMYIKEIHKNTEPFELPKIPNKDQLKFPF